MPYELKRIPWPGWEMVREIGKGSFGTVYEIRHDLITGEERAALKVLSVPQSESEIKSMRSEGLGAEEITQTVKEQAGRILQEYKNLCDLQGAANIVRCNAVHHETHADGMGVNVYILMELLTPLLDNVEVLLKTESQIISFGIDMCNALIACEKKKILHRDIKPENIFVSHDGIYKLGDFGVARSHDHTTYGTRGVGTPSYMAPEVANGGEYNKQADIYSLGIVLYWLLNKRRTPFLPLPPKGIRMSDREEAFKRRCSGEPIPEPVNGSKELKRIVLKACAFDLKDRYQSAAELLADLNALAGVPAVVVRPVTDKVEAESIPDVDSAEEETITGPVLSEASVDEDAEKTDGPIFGPVSADDAIVQDKTVGPVFVPKDKPIQCEKKRKYWMIIPAVLAIIFIIMFWPVYGKWSEWSTDIPTSEDIKLESRAEYRYRCKELIETQEEFNGISDAELVSQQENWSEYGQWGNWQEKRIEADDNCDVESATRYRSRKILVEKEYSEWSEWSNWGNQIITKSDLTDVQSRTVYEYNVYRYYVVNTGAAFPRCSIVLLAHCRKFGSHTEEQLDILQEVLVGQRPQSDLPAAGVVYQSTVLTSVDTHAYVDTSTDPYEISSGGSTWYTNSAEPSGSYTQFRSRTRTLKEKTSYSDWSDYTDEVLKADEDTDVESCVMYRCRTREKIITYQYRVWGDWSEWSLDKAEESEERRAEVRTVYRYADKYFLWEKLLGEVQ